MNRDIWCELCCYAFAGEIPADIGSLSLLGKLDLSSNRLSGGCWHAIRGRMSGTARDKDVTLSLFLSTITAERGKLLGGLELRSYCSGFGDQAIVMHDLRYLTRALLSCLRGRDSGGDMESQTADVAES